MSSKSMSAELLEQGIRLKHYNIGAHKTTCPRCSHTRKDKKDPCLWVNIKEPDLALWKCHNCLRTGHAGNVAKYAGEQNKPREYAKPAEKIISAASNALPPTAMKFFESRGITEEVVRKNKIFWEDGSICFPYFVDGVMTNVKYRTIDKRFRMVKDAMLTFYGLDDVDLSRNDPLIIVEGEMDKMALEVCGYRNVISVPNGAQKEYRQNDSQLAYLAHAQKLISEAKKIIIATDNDQPGDALRLEIARRAGLEKCWRVNWPSDIKDANEALMKLDVETTTLLVSDAKAFPIKGLYEVEEFKDSLIQFYEGGMTGGVSTGWANVDEFYTVMPGETCVITGIPNAGKSEWLDALFTNLAKYSDWNFGVFSPENGKEQHVVKLAEKIVGQSCNPNNPQRMSVEEMLNGASWVGQHFFFIVGDDEKDLPTIDFILEKAGIALLRYGIKGLIIDPWNQIEHLRPSHLTESEYVSVALGKIMRWARNHMVATFIVAHPTKMTVDKEGKVMVPSAYNISGSANWVNKPDNIIVIHRSDDIADTTEVHIRKIRFKWVGKRGETTLTYDKTTGTYKPAPRTAKSKTEADDAQLYGQGGDSRTYYANEPDEEIPF